MILPLTHEKMTVQRLPWITIGILALNMIVFLITWPQVRRDQENQQDIQVAIHELSRTHPGMTEDDFDNGSALERYHELTDRLEDVTVNSLFGRYGFVPSHQECADLVTSLFLHGGWLHLIGNLYLLWLCGCSIEDLWGRPLTVVCYLASGATAAMAHGWAFPDNEAPLVGASGAIAGMMGAFLIRLYNTRIRFFYWYWIHVGTFFAPAWVMLPLWLLSQLFYALVYGESSPVAFWAHVGGFFFGAVVAAYIKATLVEDAFLSPAIEEKTTLFKQHLKVQAAVTSIGAGRHQEAVGYLQEALRDNTEDIDALRLLGQSYHRMGRPAAAEAVYRQKLRVHLRRRDSDLAIDTFIEMTAVSPGLTLTPREVLSLAPALSRADHRSEAVSLYRQLLDSDAEATFKLKGSTALAELYIQNHESQLALDVLESVSSLTEAHPEWKTHIPKCREKLSKP